MNLSEIIEGLEDLADGRRDRPITIYDDMIIQRAIICIKELERIKQQGTRQKILLSLSKNGRRRLKYLLAILCTAWNGTLALFSTIVFSTALFKFVDRFLNNNAFVCTVLALTLIAITFVLGITVKEKLKGK